MYFQKHINLIPNQSTHQYMQAITRAIILVLLSGERYNYAGIYISELFTDLWTIERIVPSLSWLTSHNSLWPYHCSLLITHCKHVSRGGVVSSCDFRDFPIELIFESRLSFWAVNNILRCNVFIFSQHLKPESFNKEPTDQRVSLMALYN